MSSFSDNLGHNIQAFRALQKISQKDLAEYAGISPQYLSNVENGKSVPSADVTARIAKALNVSSDTLLFGYTLTINDTMKELINLANDCTQEELEMILAVSKTIKAKFQNIKR